MYHKYINQSKIMQDTYKLIARLVSSNLTILISGESGTGKKLVAQNIHKFSSRSETLSIVIDFKNLQEKELEEMFQHEETRITQNIFVMNPSSINFVVI